MASRNSADQNQSVDLASVDEWLEREALSFSSDTEFNAAVDRIMETLGGRFQFSASASQSTVATSS